MYQKTSKMATWQKNPSPPLDQMIFLHHWRAAPIILLKVTVDAFNVRPLSTSGWGLPITVLKYEFILWRLHPWMLFSRSRTVATFKLSYTSNIHIAIKKKDNKHVYMYMYFQKNWQTSCVNVEYRKLPCKFGRWQWDENLSLIIYSCLGSCKFYNLSNSSQSGYIQRQCKQHILVGSIQQPSEKGIHFFELWKRTLQNIPFNYMYKLVEDCIMQ